MTKLIKIIFNQQNFIILFVFSYWIWKETVYMQEDYMNIQLKTTISLAKYFLFLQTLTKFLR